MQFEPLEQWIWLDEAAYPTHQTTALSCMSGEDSRKLGQYTVAEFQKSCNYEKSILSVSLRTSGDTFFRLSVNGKHTVTGPASVGGDFLFNDFSNPDFCATDLPLNASCRQSYATELTLDASHPGFAEGKLCFNATVRMQPIRMFEFSKGHGGFFLTAHIRFADGTKAVLMTDKSWTATLLPAYIDERSYDGSLSPAAPSDARVIFNRWHCLTSPLPPATETELKLTKEPLILEAGARKEITLPMDMIYTGYVKAEADTEGPLEIKIICGELDRNGPEEQITFTQKDSYLSSFLTSAGMLCVTAENKGNTSAALSLSFVTSHYPVTEEAVTTTSDPELNLVLKVCNHTLKYCRQTLHLDSGSHCEPLACTGDYYIESLMTAMSFGDLRLAAFDTRRTAQLLRYHDGRMFHTTYSLIWVQMLWDVYMLTGEEELLSDCEDALTILLNRFSTYMGDRGILENPPDYMFIDWLIPDGISLHHPPKALGQTCLNLYYYGALRTAVKIYEALGEPAMASAATAQADKLQKQIITHLYDPEKELFFEGLNDPIPPETVYHWMPQNVEKRYYRKHANILGAYFGIFDLTGNQKLLHKIMTDESLGEIQPYFAHFLLEAIYRNGLCDSYTLPVLEDWKQPVKDCPFGLAEGFHKPEPTYSFDHSHAWGGTPSYALPLALSGLTVLEPGYKRISLSPSLLGLTEAHVEIPTPFGMIILDLAQGQAPRISVPDGITLV